MLERIMQVISFSEARSRFKTAIDRVVADRDATLIHRRDGENAVLLSEASYNSMMETLHLLASPVNARRLMQSVAQDRQGKARARKLLDD
jgi:antitoxin YefM